MMKKLLLLIVALSTTMVISAQDTGSKNKSDKIHYLSMAAEINFSGARIVSESGEEGGDILRFAPWFNVQLYNNWDKKNSGVFAGFTIRNIGFIYGKDNEKWKCRTYNLGIPVGLKWGDMNGTFMYAGYEFEMPIHYRERYYRNEAKERTVGIWFSDRVNQFTHAGFVGVNFKKGFNLKLKYYFTEFFNPNFNWESMDNPQDIFYAGDDNLPVDHPNYAPREYLKVNIVYLAVTWNMFRKPYYYYDYKRVEKSDQMY